MMSSSACVREVLREKLPVTAASEVVQVVRGSGGCAHRLPHLMRGACQGRLQLQGHTKDHF